MLCKQKNTIVNYQQQQLVCSTFFFSLDLGDGGGGVGVGAGGDGGAGDTGDGAGENTLIGSMVISNGFFGFNNLIHESMILSKQRTSKIISVSVSIFTRFSRSDTLKMNFNMLLQVSVMGSLFFCSSYEYSKLYKCEIILIIYGTSSALILLSLIFLISVLSATRKNSGFFFITSFITVIHRGVNFVEYFSCNS
jgi:hypothetical protein